MPTEQGQHESLSREPAPTPASARVPDRMRRSSTRNAVTGEDFALPATSPLRLGGFRIVGKLGEGGTGVVYRAIQISLERIVALKVLRQSITSNRSFVSRFLREAMVAARIDHANVVAIYDTGEADGMLYSAQQFVPGGDLHAYLQEHGPMAEDEVLRIGMQCASGLGAIHAAGLVHRDIKPSNILRAGDGTVKIGDLGVAINVLDEEHLTYSGDMVGTPAYMSPEQALAEDDIDGRSDLYALGATLYHLMTGEPPFSGPSALVVGHQVLSEMAPDPRELDERISPASAAIIHRAMRKDRALRYQTAQEVITDLELVLAHKPPHFASISAMQVERRRAQAGPGDARPWRTLTSALLAIGIIAVLTVVVVVAINLVHGDPVPDATTAAAPPLALITGKEPPPSEVMLLPDSILDHDSTPADRVPAARATLPVAPVPRALVPASTAVVAAPFPDNAVPRGQPQSQPPSPLTGATAERVANPAIAPVPSRVATPHSSPVLVVVPAATAHTTAALTPASRPAPASSSPALVPAEIPALTAMRVGSAVPPPVVAVVARSLRTSHDRPVWASSAGYDRFGPWVMLSVNHAQVRLRHCPQGTFIIGSPPGEVGHLDQEHVHRVAIAHRFWLAESECTQRFYQAVTGENPSSTQGKRLPVDQVSWQDANKFCATLNGMVAGLHARLPTEVEWEAACRAGSRGPVAGGMDLHDIAWFSDNAHGVIQPVASLSANPLGLYDMQGNVWEWCNDVDRSDPLAQVPATWQHVSRGGDANSAESSCRAAYRLGSEDGAAFVGSGLRLAIPDADG